MAGSVGVSVISPLFSLTSTSRCPVVPMKPDIGCDKARNLLSALSTSVGRVMCTSTWSPRTARPVNGMRASRKTRSTSSSSACSRSLRTELVSTCSSRLEPPCRSRPSTMWRCAQLGQRCNHAFGEEIRHREQAHDQRREHNSRRLPPREKQHRLRISSVHERTISSRCRPSPARPWREPRSRWCANGARAPHPRFRSRCAGRQ